MVRTRINDRLARAAQSPVVVVYAAAGFGKSTALTDYLEATRVAHVRYDVAPDETTLASFARGLCAAFERLVPSALAAFPSALQLAASAPEPARELANWFYEHVRSVSHTVVVDDVQHAAQDPMAIAFLRRVIEQTAGPWRWILASRSDLELPIASWMAYGLVDIPVTETDLRFSVEEALAAADAAGASEDASEIEALLAFTEAWPAAFSIALRTATHVADLRAATAGTRDLVYRYLAEQVMSRLSAERRQFLLQTCVYRSIDGDILEARGDDPAILTELRRNVAFVTPVSQTEYRYHDLFRDFLEAQASQLGPREFAHILHDAARVLESLGRYADALALSARARDANGALRTLERAGFALIDRGNAEAVQSAVTLFDVPAFAGNAAVLGIRATLESNRGRFDIAERLFPEAIDRASHPALRAELTYRYAIALVRGNRDCTDLLEPYAGDGTLEPGLRASIVATLATAYARAGRFDRARTAAAQALQIAESGVPAGVRAKIYQQAGFVYLGAGELDVARRHSTVAVEIALESDGFEVAARAYSLLYNIALDADDDPVELLRILERIEECGRKSASRQVRLFALLAAYDLEVDRGNAVALERLDTQLDEDPLAFPRARLQSLSPAQALRASWGGDFARAFALLAGTADEPDTSERRALRYAEIAVYANAARAFEEADAALGRATGLLDDCVKMSRRAARTRLFLAIAELARGRTGAAHRRIAEVERGLDAQLVRMRAFARAVRAVCALQAGQGSAPAVAAALDRLRSEQYGGIAALLEAMPFPSASNEGLASLTPAERTVLRMLTRGSSSKAIATELGRSARTVDVHVRSICRKLNCSGRLEAMAIAVAAGLVERSG
ncbi:MAG TPA: LuxR C-terminal-related transcriptional regulator [Candidatus Baltobacteraceae bacterium]